MTQKLTEQPFLQQISVLLPDKWFRLLIQIGIDQFQVEFSISGLIHYIDYDASVTKLLLIHIKTPELINLAFYNQCNFNIWP